MNKQFVFLFTMFIAMAVARQTEAQWKQSPHKWDNGVSALAANNGTLYASTSMDGMYDVNIFTSVDGINWKPLSPQLPSAYATYLFISTASDGSQYLFACTQYTIYRLKLGSAGAKWDENVDIHEATTGMAQCKKYGKSIYAACGGSGLFRSDDNGGKWVNEKFAAPDGYNPIKFTKIAVTDSNFYVATTKGLFVSSSPTDGDFAGTETFAIAQIAVAGKNIFTYSYSGGMRMSSDKGKTWTTINTGMEDCKGVYCMCTKSGNVYAGTDHGVYWYDAAKQTWKQENQGLTGTDNSVWEMAVAGTKLVIWSGNSVWYRLLAEIK